MIEQSARPSLFLKRGTVMLVAQSVDTYPESTMALKKFVIQLAALPLSSSSFKMSAGRPSGLAHSNSSCLGIALVNSSSKICRTGPVLDKPSGIDGCGNSMLEILLKCCCQCSCIFCLSFSCRPSLSCTHSAQYLVLSWCMFLLINRGFSCFLSCPVVCISPDSAQL